MKKTEYKKVYIESSWLVEMNETFIFKSLWMCSMDKIETVTRYSE